MSELDDKLPELHEQRIAVFDSGLYSEGNMKSYNDTNIWWISSVPKTSTVAKSALEELEQ